jgi:hypothetical protein
MQGEKRRKCAVAHETKAAVCAMEEREKKVHKETIVVNPSYHTGGARGPQNSGMAKQNSELSIHGRVNAARHCTQWVCAQLQSIQAWLCEVPKCRNSRADIREGRVKRDLVVLPKVGRNICIFCDANITCPASGMTTWWRNVMRRKRREERTADGTTPILYVSASRCLSAELRDVHRRRRCSDSWTEYQRRS